MSREDVQESEFRSFFGRIEDTMNCFRDLLTFSYLITTVTLHGFFGFVQTFLDNIFENLGFWCANAALQVELCRLAVQPETLQEPAKGRRDRRGRGFPPPQILAVIKPSLSKDLGLLLTPLPPDFQTFLRPFSHKRGENMTSFHECPAKVQ